MSITVSLVFNRRNQLSSTQTAPIEVYIYQSAPRLRKYLSTGISVEPAYWNSEKQVVSGKHPNAPHLNKILRDLINTINDLGYSLQASGQHLTEDKINKLLTGKKVQNDSFLDFIKDEIDPALKRGTRKEHIYTYNLLKEYKDEILFADLTYTFVQEFDRYMKVNKGFMQNTIHKHHQHINRFIRLACLKDIYEEKNNPYRNFRSKKEKSDRMSLSIDELKRIEEIEVTEVFPEINLIKEMFLFSCYTGLRFSDITTLERKHIIDSAEGLCIVKKMEKVPKPITLPLALLFEGKAIEILERYKDDPIFPLVTNQHANRQLKILATIAKIPMRLTFHIARHTFGSMLADFTQNPYLIMDLMGHSDIKTSMIYIHRSQERINKQLRGVKWE